MSFLNRVETPVSYENTEKVDQNIENGSENFNERNFLPIPNIRRSEDGKRRNAINYALGMVWFFFVWLRVGYFQWPDTLSRILVPFDNGNVW